MKLYHTETKKIRQLPISHLTFVFVLAATRKLN